jgi:cytochrome c oxidase subunit 1/cytochrome c oxidase subunit I+III
MTISIPSAVTIFAWLATMWYGRVILATPMLFALAFIVQFTIGGISGVMTAAVPFDWQVTDTYFIVAHIHYVLAGGSVFGLFAGIYYWVPKMYGWKLDEMMGKISFWLMFIGFNVGFFPMHISGLLGMPRRVYTYSESLGVTGANLTSTIGSYIFAIGILLTLWNLVRSRMLKVPAGDNPWGAASLEWLTSSPPASYNFAHIPTVTSGVPLWDGGYAAGPAHDSARLTPVTTALDADPQPPVLLPAENLWSVVIAFTMLIACVGLLVHSYLWLAIGVATTLGCAARWLWPTTARVAEVEV